MAEDAPKGPRGRRDPARHLMRLIGDAIAGGPSAQFTSIRMLRHNLHRVPGGEDGAGPRQVLDFGAGSGDRLPELRDVIPDDFDYTGIDLEVPPDLKHGGDNVRFLAYDGNRMPFDDDTFDLCFSKQVLEHVRHPDQAIGEIGRVLRPGGVFAGSVSFLEPYHAMSIFNWTPYGLVTVLRDHGFGEIELRPGIDGATMAARYLQGPKAFAGAFINETEHNHGIDVAYADERARMRNARKLAFTGHICFFAVKG
ncbi:MAG: class I SAM-dependent methyltransferase [Nocardioidaceae bacterium]|nr:class I SAM-dependent methyltransferase [Nocardioidaceae bacterium]